MWRDVRCYVMPCSLFYCKDLRACYCAHTRLRDVQELESYGGRVCPSCVPACCGRQLRCRIINYKHFFDPVHGSFVRGCIYYFKTTRLVCHTSGEAPRVRAREREGEDEAWPQTGAGVSGRASERERGRKGRRGAAIERGGVGRGWLSRGEGDA